MDNGTERITRRRFEELRRRYDTPAKQNARKVAERQRLKQAAELAGFASIVQMANALLAGTHVVVARVPKQHP